MCCHIISTCQIISTGKVSASLASKGTASRGGKNKPVIDVPSASVLLTSKEERDVECLFCKSYHDSQECEVARKLNLDERREVVKKSNSCCSSLRRGNISRKCKVRLKCD